MPSIPSIRALEQAIKQVRVLPLRVECVALESIDLPPFAGSTLRGALGHALMDAVCVVDHRQCDECRLRDDCSFPYLFDTRPQSQQTRLRGISRLPHPYVLIPPEGPRKVQPGEPFEFGVTLLGRACELLGAMAQAILIMGQRGLSEPRGRFEILGISARGEDLLSPAPHHLLGGWQKSIAGIEVAGIKFGDIETTTYAQNSYTLTTQTPLRLTRDGQIAKDIPFHLLASSMLRRSSSLLEFHHGVDMQLDYRAWIEAARQVRVVQSQWRRVKRSRFSKRQGRGMNLYGVQGFATYEGDIVPFAPLLALGQVVGVGKGTSFGLGRFQQGQMAAVDS